MALVIPGVHFSAAPGAASDLVARSGLTHREVEVLQLMARGESNAEIGQHLFISEATVKTHVARVLSQLAARSRTHAVVLAYESSVVTPGRS